MSTFHVYAGPDALAAPPTIKKISAADCFAALSEGFADFRAMPSHLAFLGFFYAVAGIALASLSSFGDAIQLVFPLAAGFALVGPFLAIGLYEMSRRRELGLPSDWRDAFGVLRSPALPAIATLGVILMLIFAVWVGAAQMLYEALYGDKPPASALDFLNDVLTTSRGWQLIGIGGVLGFVFAAAALVLSIVSFPLMLDRDCGVAVAVGTSLRLAQKDPVGVALWGLIVAAGLILGSLPLFVGLAIAMPVLGHATWRFYRRAIERDPAQEHPAPAAGDPAQRPPSLYPRPHSFLFPS